MTDLYLMKTSEAARLPAGFCRERFPLRFGRAERLSGRAAALGSIAGGALIARVLGAREDEISRGVCGKPYLTGGGRQFSLAHSGGYALLAVSDGEIGADIEAPGVCRDDAARRAFTADELEWMRADPDKRFFELWTAKESLVKLDGRGLSLGLQSFSALELVREGAMSFRGRRVFGCAAVYDGYRIALCAYEKLCAPALIQLTAEDVLEKTTAPL